jgi:CRISPR-associated protein Csy1
MSADPLRLAQEKHRQGFLTEAIAGYASYLEEFPGRGDVWHMRAVAEHQSGRLDDSWESVERALAAGGEQPTTMLLAGMLLQDRGDLAGAEARFARAAELKPGWAPPLANRGQVLMDMRRPAEALEILRAAAGIEPGNARIWNNIGLALVSLDRLDDALKTFNHALTIAPLATAHFNVARIYNLRDDVKRAFQHAEAAARADPRLTDAHLLLGDLHRKARNAEGMRKSFTDAVKSAPRNARALNAYAEFLASVGETREGREEYRRISRDNPADLKAALGANLLLPSVYGGTGELQQWRNDYVAGMAHLEAARGQFTFASEREAMLQARWTNFYLAYQGRDDRELQSRFGDFMLEVLGRSMAELLRPRVPVAERGRIRVGFCSHFFFNCTVGRYFASWITRLDRSRFEIFVYYTNEWVADDTRTIAAAADRFRHLPGRSFDVVAHEIAADDLDALVYPELGMHGETFSLASLRLAPVQVAGWGHPTTTGLPNIDYFVSSRDMEPEDAADSYRERLVLLPGLGTRYGMPVAPEGGAREDFSLPAGATLYLVPQSLFKIHPDNDALLAEVMARDANGRLVIFAAPYDTVTRAFHARLTASLARHGLELDDRVIFLPYMPHAEFLRVNTLCDVMLDTLHWSGGNTSLDALACGLPVVTLPGHLMRGRQSMAMLRLLGVEELIARDVADYVDIAVRVGGDREFRAALSARIKAGLPTLFDRDEPIRELEAFLEKAVRSRSQ